MMSAAEMARFFPRSLSWGLVLGSALLAVSCAPQDAPLPEKVEASNAVLMPVPDDPTVSFIVWFKAGSQNDPSGKSGLASLTGALISQGATTDNTYPEILDQLYPLASSYQVRVDKEMTTLVGRTHVDNIETFFGLFQGAYLRPAFDAKDFERLKSVQKSFLETSLRFSSDEELGKAALTYAVFEGSPYQNPIAGTVEGLDAITLEDVQGFYNRFYNRANVVVGLGGGFSPDLATRFEASISLLPEGEPTSTVAVASQATTGRHVLLVNKPGADASISFGFPHSVKRGEKDFYALWIANSWLGEHRHTAAQLFQVIRERRGLNYGDYSYLESFPQGGFRQMPPANVARNHQLFEGWIRTLPNEQAIFALRAALREIDNLIQNGMSKEDFELTRSFLSTYRLHFAPTTLARLGYRLDDAFYGVADPGHLESFGEFLEQVTLEEVNAAIKKHLQLDDLTIAIVTGDAEGLRSTLESGAATPIEYPTSKPPEILEEDKEIAAYPLDIATIKTIPVKEIFQR